MNKTMITEDYVSFETAALLKEKGMDVSCFNHYVHKNNNDGTSEAVTVCTLQMAMKWLLKKHNIFICVLFLEESNGFGYTIENIITKKYIATSKNSSYKKPEEAVETAIKYCLENLI